MNANLRLTKCIFGVWNALPFRVSGEPLRASRKAAGKPPGKQLGSLQERLEAFGELLGTLRRLAGSRILACKYRFRLFERKHKTKLARSPQGRKVSGLKYVSSTRRGSGLEPHLLVCIAVKCRLYEDINKYQIMRFTPEQPQPLVWIYSWLTATSSKLSDGCSCLPPISVGVVVGNLWFRV